jgi:hypothetical protein
MKIRHAMISEEREESRGGLCPKAMIAYKESLYVKGKSACNAVKFEKGQEGATLIMAHPLAIG